MGRPSLAASVHWKIILNTGRKPKVKKDGFVEVGDGVYVGLLVYVIS
jgi:hypothetical protein